MCFMPFLRFYAYEVYVCSIRIPESRSFEGKYLKPTMCVLSHFSRVRLLGTPWDLALQASLSMGFSQQENWSGLLWLPAGDPPNPRIEPASPASGPHTSAQALDLGLPGLSADFSSQTLRSEECHDILKVVKAKNLHQKLPTQLGIHSDLMMRSKSL